MVLDLKHGVELYRIMWGFIWYSGMGSVIATLVAFQQVPGWNGIRTQHLNVGNQQLLH